MAAIVHTFLASNLMKISHRLEHEFHALEKVEQSSPNDRRISKQRDRLQFRAQLFHFLGEVEAVFGIWLIPLFVAILLIKGWPTLVGYASSVNAAEPVFVVVVMAIAGSRPVLSFTETCLAGVARLGGSTVAAWWLAILTIGPLVGSFITEPAALTICALLLRQKVYDLKPSLAFRYATLALLFVNISVGGTLTHFAAPPVVMVATRWNWDLGFMLNNFGWKAVVGILIANAIYYFRFRTGLMQLRPREIGGTANERPLPTRIIVTHLLFIAWTVLVSHYPILVILGFLFFLAFEAFLLGAHPTVIMGAMFMFLR